MKHAFGKSVELKINVQNDEILLLGQAEEAAGKLLQGSLVLNLSEPIKVKSINLSFVGKMKVSWSEGIIYKLRNTEKNCSN
jgi:HEPN domain-containing protein